MKATMTTLTPVHVGNGITYNKGIDFIQAGDGIGIIDEQKILSLIGKEYIHQWIAAIEKYDPGIVAGAQPLLELLASRGKKDLRLEEISSRICSLVSLNHHSKQLKEHYRSPLKGLTIPGSSLKGALRTVILDELTQDNFDFKVTDIKYEKFDKKRKRMVTSWKFDKLDEKIFGKTANEKSTRFIHCGDIHFPKVESCIHEVRILNYEKDEWRFKSGQHFLIETIPPGISGDFAFKINTPLFIQNKKKYPQKWSYTTTRFIQENLQNFCEIVNRVTSELIEWEFDTLENESMIPEGVRMLDEYELMLTHIEHLQPNEFVIRIGANSGWIFMTAGWWRRYWDEFSADDKVFVRKSIQKKIYDLGIWPKTRKISSEGLVFGFVKVKLVVEN